MLKKETESKVIEFNAKLEKLAIQFQFQKAGATKHSKSLFEIMLNVKSKKNQNISKRCTKN